MRFVDRAKIYVKSGNGGNGCMSFRKEKFVAKGGPDGGNGGHGGDIIFEARNNLHSLADFENARHFHAESGVGGKGKKKHGKMGEDRIIEVPCGTSIYDETTGQILAELMISGDRFIVAPGGRGGRGNAHFANSINKTPRFAEKGEPGKELWLRLELRLLADIGLVGFPNAGKSSLLCSFSNAKAKIGEYPFTTITPNLGVIFTGDHRITVADVPGLIEGAHENKGLGLSFLRHIERTELLVHVFDLSLSVEMVLQQWEILREEFSAYDKSLSEKPLLVVGNKTDLIEKSSEAVRNFLAFFEEKGISAFLTSAKTGEGVPELVEYLISNYLAHPKPQKISRYYVNQNSLEEGRAFSREPQLVFLEKGEKNRIQVLHPHLEKAVERYDFDQDEALHRFHNLLLKYNVEKMLLASGAQTGDTIVIGSVEFDFEPEIAE
ncbi:MAG TPA: GTPase ObgE [Synergistaceae bacterium]|nr:GTPase ObgE [Synergistaceae bacterium]HPQ36244.1 GTPase ObgE [Synergistaceae bacterium]